MRVELAAITAGYGDTVVLRDLNLVLPSGKVTAVLGPNGAGKTTLLRVTSGLIQPTSGTVVAGHRNLTGRSPDTFAREGICHITEGRAIFPSLSVRENLRLFAPPGRESSAAERAIEEFPKLGQRLRQLAGTMSGGEQQMLAAARAYMADASVVLLDEVSMGLAPIIVDEVFEFVHVLAASGIGLLIVEQYVNKALALADFVYVMARGSFVFAGEPTELETSDVFTRYLGEHSASAEASV